MAKRMASEGILLFRVPTSSHLTRLINKCDPASRTTPKFVSTVDADDLIRICPGKLHRVEVNVGLSEAEDILSAVAAFVNRHVTAILLKHSEVKQRRNGRPGVSWPLSS